MKLKKSSEISKKPEHERKSSGWIKTTAFAIM
jgi:hypothetical protein